MPERGASGSVGAPLEESGALPGKECIGLQGNALFISLFSQFFAGSFGGLLAFSNHANAPRHLGAISEANASLPLLNFPRASNTVKRLCPFE